MKIAHIVCVYPPYFSGMGNVAFQMVHQLRQKGNDVIVYTPQYVSPSEIKMPDEQEESTHAPAIQEQIEHVRRLAPSLSYGNAAYIPQILQELDDVDIVHLHYPFFGTANLIRKWKKKHPEKKLVVSYHMDPRANGWKGLLFRYYSAFWMPKILHEADCIIAASFDYIQHSAASTLFAQNPKKWVEIPFGVDIDYFTPQPASQLLAKQLGIRGSTPTLLFVGGMDIPHYFKGIPVLLNAIALLKKQGVDLQLILIGKGELQERFRAMAKVLGIADSVYFAGGVANEDLPYYYNLATGLVLPSINQAEAFGMVLLEAYASAIPVLATDLPGVRVVAQKAGIVVPPHNIAALADGIQELMQLGRDSNIRQSCRFIAEQEYSWELVGERLHAVYTDLLK